MFGFVIQNSQLKSLLKDYLRLLVRVLIYLRIHRTYRMIGQLRDIADTYYDIF